LNGTLGESFAFQTDGAENGFAGDAEFQVGALDDIVDRRCVGFLGRLGSEREKAVVFLQRKRDVAGGRRGGREHSRFCRRGGGGEIMRSWAVATEARSTATAAHLTAIPRD